MANRDIRSLEQSSNVGDGPGYRFSFNDGRQPSKKKKQSKAPVQIKLSQEAKEGENATPSEPNHHRETRPYRRKRGSIQSESQASRG